MQGVGQTADARAGATARGARNSVARFSVAGCACFVVPAEVLHEGDGETVVGAVTLGDARYAICTTSAAREKPAQDVVALLTARELEIAALIAAGCHNKEIGRRLSISPFTVGAHIARIFTKLRVSSRSALAAQVVARLGSAPVAAAGRMRGDDPSPRPQGAS